MKGLLFLVLTFPILVFGQAKVVAFPDTTHAPSVSSPLKVGNTLTMVPVTLVVDTLWKPGQVKANITLHTYTVAVEGYYEVQAIWILHTKPVAGQLYFTCSCTHAGVTMYFAAQNIAAGAAMPVNPKAFPVTSYHLYSGDVVVYTVSGKVGTYLYDVGGLIRKDFTIP